MTDANKWNQKIIDEFRANGGRVGGQFEGVPMLVLHHIGAKSGSPRENPVMYQETADGWAVFASAAGADTNPAWYHNLLAHPDVEIEVGTETIPVRARVLGRDERDPVWETQKQRFPAFAEYEKRTSRVIPVVLLERR
ncbi:nitroreductase family deazaflavin-dependent oxidoreductase [Streptomyces sp. NPDC052701]|uniref:nitroreductase family deazaflavin-dependent oxidoreductase n=1 Tax=Streptomyces sp. NPDC052701 TaxID=3155533 RepID=UPI0034120AF1